MLNTDRLIENRYYSIELEKCTTPQCFGNMHGKEDRVAVKANC